MQKWQILNSRDAFVTPYFKVRQDECQLPDGRVIDDYYVVDSPGIALVVARTTGQEFLLVEQYKHGIGEICIEIVGGLCEEDSSDPLEDARRELREETGYTSDTWVKLATFYASPTRANNHIHIYLALDAKKVGEQVLDPNESINVLRLPQAQIMDHIRKGKIKVADSVSGLLLALDYLQHHPSG